MTRAGEDLSDAVAHEPGADDGDPLDRHGQLLDLGDVAPGEALRAGASRAAGA